MLNNPVDKELYPNSHSGYAYAIDVVCGEIPSCVYVLGACHRFLKDWEKAQDENNYYYFDLEKSEDYLKKVQLFEHVIGEWDTKEIIYLPWQNFLWMNIRGFRHRNNPRNPRFRVAHVEVPRGSAKSTMASQSALYYVGLDKPLLGNQVSCFATKSDQSRIVMDASRAMANKAKKYQASTGVEVQAHKIVHAESNSFVRAMAADSNGLDGLNDILAIMDELHAMSRSLFDVVYSGLSKRRDSLMLCITTAGFNTDSVGFSQSAYAKKVAKGELQDDQFFSLVYTIDEGDDIFSEISWRKSNPNFGYSVDPVSFAAKAMKAKETPADLPNFKVKHLNMWLSEGKAFFDLAAWDKCADPTLSIEQFFGKKCQAGIDLASKIDLASFAFVFRENGIYYIFDKTYIPKERAEQIRNTLFDNCIGTGHLIPTTGDAINYEKLEEDFEALSKKVKIVTGLFDPWNAVSFGQKMTSKRINMVEFRMTTANLSEPTKNLDVLMRQGKIRHNGSPLLRFCMGNVVVKEDAAGNIFPRKSNDRLKIDPVIAILMCIAQWMNEAEEQSVYEIRGIRTL